MKKILLLLLALIASVNVWAEDYITDVMVIGGSKSVVNDLKETYTSQGWTVIDQDLNKGCGSSSDYIYLLYKSASETDVEAGTVITNFLISTATGTIPDSFLSNDRTYHLVPFDGSDYFKGNKGDLNSHCGSSSATIHLYFTREYDPDGKDYSTVKSIAFNDTQSGGVPVAGAPTGYDFNTGAGGDYIYMHAEKAQGWQVSVNTAGTQCYVTGFDGPKRNFKDIVIPSTIDGATLLGFSMTFSGFANLETMFFPMNSSITQMPSVQGCSKFYNVKTSSFHYQTPSSMTSIPGYAFAGTAIKEITFQSVTSVGSDVFSGCKKLSSVTFKKSPVLIENHAFSNIKSYCSVSYPGSIEDWNPMMYMYSPMLVVNGPNNSWHCGWCGGDTVTSNNHLYWTLQNNHLKINCATDIWDTYPGEQMIDPYYESWDADLVQTLTLEHVDTIVQFQFLGQDMKYNGIYSNLTVVDVKSGLKLIDYGAFFGCPKLEKVYLPSCLDSIEAAAFGYCRSLADIYFDGTGKQWNDSVAKGVDWNSGVSDNYKEHWHCVVTYNANGHGTAPAPVSIQWSNEDKLDEPTAPTADGYVFTGWYKEPDCINRWDFNTEVPGDMTLYAGWEPVVVSKPGDANEDSQVDVLDVTTVINYILNKNPNPFNYNNANVNGDAKVDVLDVTLIINIILGLQ